MDNGQIGIRISPELRSRIQENVGKDKCYKNITTFVLAAIEEKLDPDKIFPLEEERLIKLLNKPNVRDRIRELLQE